MPQENPRVRFAPSPTGHLHVGNARTALFNRLFARGQNGTFILRIEDTDVQRSDPKFERQLREDIRWLGLDWDEGPDVEGPFGPYRQSERTELYRQYALPLIANGNAYYCFCSAQELEEDRKKALAERRQPRYSGKCLRLLPEEAERRLDAGEEASIRLKIPEGEIGFADLVHGRSSFASDTLGDFILLRPGGQPAYNFAVVVDDHLMQVSHVIRGDDHISNTPRQIAAYRALGWVPPRFAHLSTLLGSDRTRLSKRHEATSVDHFRQLGILPEALTNYLALLGWSAADGVTEIFSPQELVRQFSLSHITKSPAVFDPQKLYWLNRHYLKQAPLDRLVDQSLPILQSLGWVEKAPSVEVKVWLCQVLDAVLKNLNHLSELADHVGFIFNYDATRALASPENRVLIDSEASRDVVSSFRAKIQEGVELDAELFRRIIAEVREATRQKGKNLYHPLRMALTGQVSGPEMDKLIPIIEQGAKLPLPKPLNNCADRLDEFMQSTWGSSP